MGGSPNTSPTGRHARSCWPRRVHTPKPATRTKSQSVSSATPPSAASCSSVSRPWRLDLLAGCVRNFSIHFEVVPDHYLSMIGFLNLAEQLVIGDAAVGSAAGGVIDN